MGQNKGLYQAAAYLDPTSFIYLSAGMQQEAETWIKDNLCLPEEIAVPGDEPVEEGSMLGDIADLLPCFSGLGDSGIINNMSSSGPTSSIADMAFADYKAKVKEMVQCKITIPPNATGLDEKKELLKAAQEKHLQEFKEKDTLETYAKWELNRERPLIRKWAAILFAVRVNQSHIENFFSHAGRTWDVSRAARFGAESGSKLTLLRIWLKQDLDVQGNATRLALSNEKCKKFLRIVGDTIVTTSGAADDIEDEEDEQVDTIASASADNNSKPWFEGEFEDCPIQTKDVAEGKRIAVYFEDINKWESGTIKLINRRIRSLEKDNVTVDYGHEGLYNFCLHPSSYGPNKFWVLPSAAPVTTVPDTMGEVEDEFRCCYYNCGEPYYDKCSHSECIVSDKCYFCEEHLMMSHDNNYM